jgi:hypothetical protein
MGFGGDDRRAKEWPELARIWPAAEVEERGGGGAVRREEEEAL